MFIFLKTGWGKTLEYGVLLLRDRCAMGKKKVNGIEDYLLINPFQNAERVSFGSKISNPVKYTTSDNFFQVLSF